MEEVPSNHCYGLCPHEVHNQTTVSMHEGKAGEPCMSLGRDFRDGVRRLSGG